MCSSPPHEIGLALAATGPGDWVLVLFSILAFVSLASVVIFFTKPTSLRHFVIAIFICAALLIISAVFMSVIIDGYSRIVPEWYRAAADSGCSPEALQVGMESANSFINQLGSTGRSLLLAGIIMMAANSALGIRLEDRFRRKAEA
jgi:hypothetical protein